MTSPAKRSVMGLAAFALILLFGLVPRTAMADRDDGRLQGEARKQALAKARAVEAGLVDVVERVTGASVTILTRRAVGRGRPRTGFVAGAGSGVLVKYRGLHVLTNNHVVAHPGQLEIVNSEGRRYSVRVRARDKANDLAVLTIDKPDGRLQPVDLERRATTRLREGAWVVATGNPFLLAADGGSVATLGVFSGTRKGPKSQYLLQHDAEINPGNSGGPLWNLKGQLLGLNGAIVTRSMTQGGGPSYTGASITVPVARARAFLDRVLPKAATPPPPSPTRRAPVSTAAVLRAGPQLGLRLVSSLAPNDQPDGVLITGVVARGIAASSQSPNRPQAGDRITGITVGGRAHAVESISDLDSLVGRRDAGTAFALTFERDGDTRIWSGVVR